MNPLTSKITVLNALNLFFQIDKKPTDLHPNNISEPNQVESGAFGPQQGSH